MWILHAWWQASTHNSWKHYSADQEIQFLYSIVWRQYSLGNNWYYVINNDTKHWLMTMKPDELSDINITFWHDIMQSSPLLGWLESLSDSSHFLPLSPVGAYNLHMPLMSVWKFGTCLLLVTEKIIKQFFHS